MNLVFTSKLYREEFKHWILIICLFVWASTTTVLALQNKSQTILIGIDENGTRIINSNSDLLTQNELKNLLKTFFENYYSFSDRTFSSRISQATELMSGELWDRQKGSLLELAEKLKKTPLTQTAEIESIDLIDERRIEAILLLKITSRLSEQRVRIKVNLEFKKVNRSERNPWGYEITELTDATI